MNPLPVAPYRAPAWLPGGHAQTIYPLVRRGPLPRYRRERWETPDGDFIDVDWLPEADADAPLVVLFHGLEGSSASHYARALMRALARRGWAGALPHFRGCSGEPNRLPRAYHSGDSEEIDWILRRLRAQFPGRTIFAAGISLGGNALLKWLGEREGAARDVVQAAAAACAPLDLTAAGHALQQGFNRVYTQRFLLTLKASSLAKLERFPGLFDRRRMLAARTLHDFDDAVTAPLHGFRDAADYWRRAAAKPWLPGVRVPTLALNALNDPFLPAAALPRPPEVAPAVTLDYPREGGHVGFVAGPFPGHLGWLPQRLLAHFDAAS
ncbi:MAG: hydrolase [Rhodocyclales bacterium]|nr:hydrolase [Rhodocyclales bacterium]